MENKMKYLIIPDVHGRAFWKDPVFYTLKDSDAHIIFLGDFLDPYPFEWKKSIDYKRLALERFREIIQFKKDNLDRITLLLGNHDCEYCISTDICDCRRDRGNQKIIEELFEENRELFQLAKEDTINGKHFIFSHAGILKGWVKKVFGGDADDEGFNIVDELNDAWKAEKYGILYSLGMYDHYRGWGGGEFGSPVWSDIRTWIDKREDDTYGYNIVGHTYCEKDPIAFPAIACLDCRRAFYIDDEGSIKDYDSNEIVEIPKI